MTKILFAASEAVPFIKTGGLADVAGTLPTTLNRAGLDVRVILPKYKDLVGDFELTYLTHFYVNLGWRRQYCGLFSVVFENTTFYFIDNEFYFGRESVYGEGQGEGERFGFFCRAVLEAMQKIEFYPDILHCNDWQTGMIPVLLRTQYMHLPDYANIRTVFTIHNLKFQGMFDYGYIDELLGLGSRYFSPEFLEYYGGISFMKGGIVFSDMITTVSPTYAMEIQTPYFGERMDGLLRARSNRLEGILNGIDNASYDPRNDFHLPFHFSKENRGGKWDCKRALQHELGLEDRYDVPVVAIITRLTEQKGLDLIERVLDDMMKKDIQLIVLGTGDYHYHELFTWAQWRYEGRLATYFSPRFSISLS